MIDSKNQTFTLGISIVVSIIAVSLTILHVIAPNYVDYITILLFIVIVIVWLPNIKSIEFPGGPKLEFHKIKDAVDEVIGDKEPNVIDSKEKPVYEQIFEIDPNLSLVYFRIEIERRVRELAENNGIHTERRGLSLILRELQGNNIMSSDISAHGLIELIQFGNQAAHGIEVPKDAAKFMLDAGPKIIAILDEVIGAN
jgi:hypothetical protein